MDGSGRRHLQRPREPQERGVPGFPRFTAYVDLPGGSTPWEPWRDDQRGRFSAARRCAGDRPRARIGVVAFAEAVADVGTVEPFKLVGGEVDELVHQAASPWGVAL